VNIGGLTVPDPVVGALSTILVSVIGGIIYFEYKRRRRSTDQTKEWYAEAIGIIGRLQQAGQQTTMFAQETNEEAIKSKFEPIATELQSHAGNAPEQVEDQARAELIYLSTIASAIISLSDQSEDASISAVFQEAQELARENSTVDYDLEEINERFDLGNLGSGKEQIDALGFTQRYSKRWDIEIKYKMIKPLLPSIASKDYRMRYFCFVFSCLLYNMWRVIDHEAKVLAMEKFDQYGRGPHEDRLDTILPLDDFLNTTLIEFVKDWLDPPDLVVSS